jgi:hypothetical protein
MRPHRIEEDWGSDAALGGGRPVFRRRQWVAVVVLLLVLALSGFAVLVPRLFRAADSELMARAGEQAEVETDLEVLGPFVQAWAVAHGGALPRTVEEVDVPDEDGGGQRLLDPWGNAYVIESVSAGETFRLVSLGSDGVRGSGDVAVQFSLPVVVLVGLVDGTPHFVLGKRDTESEDELERWLREALAERGGDTPLHVVAAPGTPHAHSGRAADVALRAGFTDVGFADLAR